MGIDWDTLVGRPLMGVFGDPVHYVPDPASPIAAAVALLVGGVLPVVGVFDAAYTPVELGAEPSAISARPVLGVQLSSFPAGYDLDLVQGDRFTVLKTGVTYIVKAGKPDSHGAARLEANVAP